MSLAKRRARRPHPPGDGPAATIGRTLLYSVGLLLFMLPIATVNATVVAVVMAFVGVMLARALHVRALRTVAAVTGAAVLLIIALCIARYLVTDPAVAARLGIRPTLATAEVASFGALSLAIAFLLRFLALKRRALSLVEVLFVVGSTVALLLDHRNRMINRPRFLSDWAWSVDLNPIVLLTVFGMLTSIAAVFFFLRGQRLLKLLVSIVTLLLLGGSALALWHALDVRVDVSASGDPLGLNSENKDSKNGGGAGGFKDDYSSSQEPTPVAVAILRDELETHDPVLYFRQSVLSQYNGHRLVTDTQGTWDGDVVREIPRTGALRAAASQSPDNHLKVPTSMFLIVDHPQPLALTHAAMVKPTENPNPKQFVAAYDVESLVLSVPTSRLLGRKSVPPSWSAARKRHYTELPEDPRYRTLADILVRDVDPRFAEDDLAKAFAIKRFLEKEGFYTMRSRHQSATDPAASFLFGSLRGYCVHFSHAAVYLMRSQGIAARVALGYAVQINKRSGGSSLLIMSDRAHAWPEIHLDGIGWVTFDVYPERTDMPPATPVDYDLEKLLGELARRDPTGGQDKNPHRFHVPWRATGAVLLAGLLTFMLLGYGIKIGRRLAPAWVSDRAYPRVAYRAVLDRLADLGAPRMPEETRERHAARLSPLAPSLDALTREHLSALLGQHTINREHFGAHVRKVHRELSASVSLGRRLLGTLNPVGWLFTR